MVKKSGILKNLEKSRKISKKKKKFNFFIFPRKKKLYRLSFPILGGRDSTRARVKKFPTAGTSALHCTAAVKFSVMQQTYD